MRRLPSKEITQSFKIRSKNTEHSKEILRCLFDIGCKWVNTKDCDYKYLESYGFGVYMCVIYSFNKEVFDNVDKSEISLKELHRHLDYKMNKNNQNYSLFLR